MNQINPKAAWWVISATLSCMPSFKLKFSWVTILQVVGGSNSKFFCWFFLHGPYIYASLRRCLSFELCRWLKAKPHNDNGLSTESDKYRRVDAVMGDTLVLGCSTTQSSGVDWTQNSSYVYVNGTITGHRNILIQFSVVNTSEGVNSLRIYNVHPVYSGWYDCYETDGRRIIGYHVVATSMFLDILVKIAV